MEHWNLHGGRTHPEIKSLAIKARNKYEFPRV